MGFKTNHFNEFISFKDWLTNFEDIENTKENYLKLEKVGIPLESISEETKIIRNFNFGGFNEILNNGKYYLCLGNEDWLEDDNKKIENELYNWCCGELFNWNNKLSDHIEITRKVMEHCEKDKSYLWEIVNEYIELLEDSELGLKGIKETLEEREEYKSNSGCELEDVSDEFYNEKGELKQ